MSDREMWKMLHLLYTLKPGIPGLTPDQLLHAGIDCNADTIQPLLDGETVAFNNGLFELTRASRRILQTCVVANRRWAGKDLRVDQPEVFVVMPFSQDWSDDVYRDLILPAVEGAHFRCIRGDTDVRVGDLTQTIWSALMTAGLIVAEVSALNANVFYEIGLAHALGKDTFLLKQDTSTVPADFGGAHYYEYALDRLDDGRQMLQQAIEAWAVEQNVDGVEAINHL